MKHYRNVGSEGLIAGLLGAILNLSALIILWITWGVVSFVEAESDIYSHDFSSVTYIHIFIIGLLIAALSGAISAYIGSKYFNKKSEALASGSITGFIMSVSPASPNFMICYSIFASLIQPYHSYGPLDNYFLMVFLSVVTYVPLAVLGAYMYTKLYIKSKPAPTEEKNPRITKKLTFSKMITIVILLLLLASLIPQGIAAIGMNAGWFKLYKADRSYTIDLIAERLNDGSIIIKNNGGLDAGKLKKDMPFIVKINGKDVTNNSVIKDNMITATIDPASGLGYENGSQVIINGADITNINTKQAYVIVIGNFGDDTRQIVLNTYV